MKIAILISALFLTGCDFLRLSPVHYWPATPVCNPDCAGEDERQRQLDNYLCRGGYTDNWHREQARNYAGITCIEGVADPVMVEPVEPSDELVKACAIENKAERERAVKDLGYHHIAC